jgi:hypothetical protein
MARNTLFRASGRAMSSRRAALATMQERPAVLAASATATP